METKWKQNRETKTGQGNKFEGRNESRATGEYKKPGATPDFTIRPYDSM